MKTVVRRLARVEAMPKPRRAPTPSVVPIIIARLAALGFVQGPNESPAETMARAFGMTTKGLREEFQRRAAGG